MDSLSFATISGNSSVHKRPAGSRAAKRMGCGNGGNSPDYRRSNAVPSGTGGEASTGDHHRRFRHAINGHGGIDSICRRCRNVIASSADEWSLLASEERHVCGAQNHAIAGWS